MKKDDTVLLIIDMQKDFLEKGKPLYVDGGRAVIPKIKEVLQACRKAGIKVVHVVREHRPDGSDIEKYRLERFKENPYAVEGTRGAEEVDELKPEKSEIIVKKKRYSAFFHTEFDLVLRRLGIRNIVIAGIQTPNCIRATAVDALALDYDVTLISDAIAAKSDEIHKSNLRDMENMTMKVVKAGEFIKELK